MLNNNKQYLKILERVHRKYFDSLPEDIKQSILYYTGEGYKNINDYLRGIPIINAEYSPESIISSIHHHIDNINKALSGAPALEYALEVYRGVSLPSNTVYSKGDIINLFHNGFTSTSFDIDISSEYSGDECCMFILYLPIGTHGLYIGKQSKISDEYEYLVAPGYDFKITDLPMKNISKKKPQLNVYRASCVNCQPSKYHSQATEQMIKSYNLLNIDKKILDRINPTIVDKVKELNIGCPPNKITNPRTGRCVDILGKSGQSILNDLEKMI